MTLPRAEPRYFGPAARLCFGWLHCPRPDAPRPAMGLVVCNPFGYEALCSHRSLRHFAEAAAAAGVPALRFDFDGTGDSAGDDRDSGRWAAWLASVHLAVAELRRATGVERACLLGVRLGATLAATAASERDDVSGLVAIAPVVSGKGWLREVNALQIALGHGEPPPGLAQEAGIHESVGFVLTDETRTSVAGVDLLDLARRPASDVLILDRSELPSKARWAERLIALGSRVDHRRVPEYAEMMLDPHDTVVPAGMLRAVSVWLSEQVARSDRERPAAACRPAILHTAAVVPGVEETAGFWDESRTLFGIASVAAATPRPARAIVLLNAGAIHHVGPTRLYVHLARRWAARGYLVLRFDLAGIGDSAPRPGESENVVYSPWAERDIAAVLSRLRDESGVTECRAMGLCSGAYHALKAAVAGLPLNGVVLVNPLVFFWKKGMSLSYPAHQVVDAAAQYRKSTLRLDKWKKFFAGKVDVRAFAEVTARRTASVVAGWIRDGARRVGRPLAEDLGAELEAVARRHVALRFVFAAGDPGEELLRTQAGSSLRRLWQEKRLQIQRIEGPDHSFTPVWSHAVLASALESALDVR